MWLFYIALPLVVLAIIATIAGGGIFSIVLIPLAVVAIVAAAWSVMSARSANAPGAHRRSRTETGPSGSALPHSFSGASHTAADSPEALTDRRRELQ